MTQHLPFQEHGRTVLTLEADAVAALVNRVGEQFVKACELILQCTKRKGRVVVVGIGKSGHVGGKVAATLASTGTPAFFVHPGEASHGDLGMITPDDVVLAISNSGETTEILTILPIIKRMGITLVVLTGNTSSSLCKHADATIDVSVEKEACPLNLSPTASTTAALAMGDALAVAVLKAREFTEEDFARAHPGGQLGRRLLLYVEDIMQRDERIPCVSEDASLREALLEMTSKGLGMTAIVDKQNRLRGIYTDGDLRRTLNQKIDVYKAKITDVMMPNPKTVGPDKLAEETVQMMRQLRINGLFVVDAENRVIGAFNMHDLLRAGIV
ncbi:MAG: KpsF/GutQ family sugar-phosphate isomerase [Acidiferrobacterales bacterium]